MIDRLVASYDPGAVPMPLESACRIDRGESSKSQANGGSSAIASDGFQEMGALVRSASIDEVEFDLMRLDNFLRTVQDNAYHNSSQQACLLNHLHVHTGACGTACHVV